MSYKTVTMSIMLVHTSDNSGNMTLFMLLLFIFPLEMRLCFCAVGEAIFVTDLLDDTFPLLLLCDISLDSSRLSISPDDLLSSLVDMDCSICISNNRRELNVDFS